MPLNWLPEPSLSSLFRKLFKSLINNFAIPENVNAQGTPEIFFLSSKKCN